MMNISQEFSRLDTSLLRSNPCLFLQTLTRSRAALQPMEPSAAYLDSVLDSLLQMGLALTREVADRLVTEGWMTPEARMRIPEAHPGVVGLALEGEPCEEKPGVGAFEPLGYVIPLTASRADRWSVEPEGKVPFKEADLVSLLRNIVGHLGLRDFLPELAPCSLTGLVPCSFTGLVPRNVTGRSMDVAGLLAVLGGLHDSLPPLLEGACAMVYPSPAQPQLLEPVEGAHLKLEAFQREIGRGALLVRHPRDLVSARFDGLFERVWECSSMRQLTIHSREHELLDPLLLPPSPGPDTLMAFLVLLRGDIERGKDLPMLKQRCLAAKTIVERMGQVPSEARTHVDELLARVHRHTGNHVEAARLDEGLGERFSSTGEGDINKRLSQEARSAAAQIDSHDYHAAHDRLQKALSVLEQRSQDIAPEVHWRVWNTLGRILSALGLSREQWEPLFLRSLEWQREHAPHEMDRTRGYLVHALLKSSELGEAERRLREYSVTPDPYNRLTQGFLHGDLARRQGRTYEDPELEVIEESRAANHPLAFYWQATARQEDRCDEDRRRRFGRALHFMVLDRDDDGGPENLLSLLSGCTRVALGAYVGDDEAWFRGLDMVAAHLECCPGARAHYEGHVPDRDCPKQDRVPAAEHLLARTFYL